MWDGRWRGSRGESRCTPLCDVLVYVHLLLIASYSCVYKAQSRPQFAMQLGLDRACGFRRERTYYAYQRYRSCTPP